MPIVRIPTDEIADWNSFHDVFAKALGFLEETYGRTMGSWVDHVMDMDDPDIGLTIYVRRGDVLTLELENAGSFAARCPEQFQALVDSSALVNWGRVHRSGAQPFLALSYQR
jgi:hypothetical protein